MEGCSQPLLFELFVSQTAYKYFMNSPGLPVSVDDVHEVCIVPVEPGPGGDVEPVEGVGHVTGKQRTCRVQPRDTGQPQALNTGLLLVNN